MTPQEQEMIDGLISRIRGTQVKDKDSAAEQRIRQGLSGYPDSLYVLAQTVLVQQYGLGQAQSQLEDLKQQNAALQDQVQQLAQGAQGAKSSGGSFLSHIFGGGTSPSAPPPQAPPYQPVNSPTSGTSGYGGQPAQGGYPPAYPSQGYPAPSGGGGMFGGGGGFLQGALQTAAGVAAGEIAFQGMEDLFHGFSHGGEGRGFGGGGFGGSGGGETVVNNYYDDDRSGGNGGDRGDGGRDSGNFYNPSEDASRSDADSSTQFADTGNDDMGTDDTGNDNSGFDDNSSFDDGGSDDMSGNM